MVCRIDVRIVINDNDNDRDATCNVTGGTTIEINKTNGITAEFVIYNGILIHIQNEYYCIYGICFILVVLLTKGDVIREINVWCSISKYN